MYHFTELRYRLLYIFVGYLISVIISYSFIEELLYLISKPLIQNNLFSTMSSIEERRFIYTNVTEAFTTQLTLSLYSGLYINIPVIVYHLVKFLKPGLYKNENLFLNKILFLGLILLYCSLTLTFSILIPEMCDFFLGFETSLDYSPTQIQLEAKISEYVHGVLYLTVLMNIITQYPLLLLILIHFGLINYNWLIKQRKLFIFLFFILGALCTPPDVLSQVSLAILLVLFYDFVLVTLLLYTNYMRVIK
jgi:sec-independent protein translocase protein TatC